MVGSYVGDPREPVSADIRVIGVNARVLLSAGNLPVCREDRGALSGAVDGVENWAQVLLLGGAHVVGRDTGRQVSSGG
jgi:hypothetical protein